MGWSYSILMRGTKWTPCRFLGTRPIRLVRVTVQKNPAILALSSRSWLNYTHQNRMHFTPLILDNLDYAWGFSAELCPEGLIGIAGSTLRSVIFFRFSSDENKGPYSLWA